MTDPAVIDFALNNKELNVYNESPDSMQFVLSPEAKINTLHEVNSEKKPDFSFPKSQPQPIVQASFDFNTNVDLEP